ncbi:MAG: Ig domain protein group 2 domain protein [Parcubacteria group bacterium GW2011_GWE2_39_37]|nr:MAG: Ig domain protein group 2 domain protein [Parcubacteria group bacterium GW2011_GWE2_39_37]
MMNKRKIFTSLFILSFLFLVNPSALAIDLDTEYPDLAATDITVVPASPALNQKTIVTISVKNNGNRSLISSNGLAFKKTFDNFILTDSSFPTPNLTYKVSPGATMKFVLEGYFTQIGEASLSFMIDSNNDVFELTVDSSGKAISAEANNTVIKKITVVDNENTDIAVDSIAFNNLKPLTSKDVEIRVGFKNIGKVSLNSEEAFDNNVMINSPNFVLNNTVHDAYPSSTKPLNPGEKIYYTFKGFFALKGEQSFYVRADHRNVLKEIDKNNNASTTKIMVYENADAANDFDILNPFLGIVSSTSAIVKWETTLPTTGKISYRIFNEPRYIDVVDNEKKASHSVIIKDLMPYVNYNFKFIASNDTVNKGYEFQNIATISDDDLKITKIPTVIRSSNNAIITWETNLMTIGKVYYKNKNISNANFLVAGDNASTFERTVSLVNLDPGEYEFYVVATSTPGIAVQSAKGSFRIGDAPLIPPTHPAESTTSTPAAKPVVTSVIPPISVKNEALYSRLKGKIILKTESKGEAYYINPSDKKMYFLGRPDDAFKVMRERGIGISNTNLKKVQIGINDMSGADSDGDGLPDSLEAAIGTNLANNDTDGDGYGDKEELVGGYNPLDLGKLVFDNDFAKKNSGKIFLQIEGKGEAWYINPADNKRYFLGRPVDAFNVMRKLGLGVGNKDFEKL